MIKFIMCVLFISAMSKLPNHPIKNDYEIKQIRKASEESSKILKNCIKKLSRFTYEKDVKRCLEHEAKKKGYKLAYKTIVASGKNGAYPHYHPCKDKLKRGFLVIDFGVKVNGYCSDITRTLFLGKPTRKERNLYNKVLSVQKRSISMFNKNKSIDTVGKYARRKLGKEFIHALGHGIGRRIHEHPKISFKNKNKIKNRTCFTIEPGVYREGRYGIRIEDTIVKLNNKLKILTPIKKELIVINNKIYK